MKHNAADPRAYNHLRALLDRSPRLLSENPALVKDLQDCGDAVAFAQKVFERILKDYNS